MLQRPTLLPDGHQNPGYFEMVFGGALLFDEKIGNNYIVMKKSLKFSFSLFKIFLVGWGNDAD